MASYIVADAWLDFASLSSYLQLNAFRRALRESAITDKVITHPRAFFNMSHMSTQAVEQARAAGISIAEDLPSLDTHLAHRLVAGLDDDTPGPDSLALKVAEGIMRSYFELGLDIGRNETLISIAQDFGVSAERTQEILANPALTSLVEEAYTLALHLGATEAPKFLFDEQFLAQAVTEEDFLAVLTTLQEKPSE